jgi:hypothetical protein
MPDERHKEKESYQMSLETLKLSQLATIFNHLFPEKPVKKFADKEAAVRRVSEVMAPVAKLLGTTVQKLSIQLHPEMSDADLLAVLSEDYASVAEVASKVAGDDRAADERVLKKLNKKAKAPDGERKTRQKRFFFKPMSTGIKAPAEKSRRMRCLQMLLREKGATLEEVMKSIEWTERQAYEGIRLCHYAHGYGLKQDDAGRVYAYEK